MNAVASPALLAPSRSLLCQHMSVIHADHRDLPATCTKSSAEVNERSRRSVIPDSGKIFLLWRRNCNAKDLERRRVGLCGAGYSGVRELGQLRGDGTGPAASAHDPIVGPKEPARR
jgi:hypothetical protein